jgi:hypothetical protein
LAGWPGLKRLRVLDLSGCNVTGPAAQALARSPYLHPGLQLRLDDNPAAVGELVPRHLVRRPPSVS